MRNIKFRAWNKVDKKMGKSFTLQEAIRVRPFVDPTDDCIYLQFTGLRDKKRTKKYPNGQEIYEGDIVKDFDGDILFVEWGDFVENYYEPSPGFRFRLSDKTKKSLGKKFEYDWRNAKLEYLEVIGNIYQDKELLT